MHRFMSMRKLLSLFVRDKRGATAIEYSAILSGLLLITLPAVQLAGNNTNSTLNTLAGAIVVPAPPDPGYDQHITGTESNDILAASAGSRAWIEGLGGNDTLQGSTANDILDGGEGDDTLQGNGGNDTYTGGVGSDTVDYSTSDSNGLTASLANPNLNTGAAAGNTYSSIENLTGTAGDDNLSGDDSNNILNGMGGNDTLDGMGGNDTLIGGSGADILTGGSGTDIASYITAASGVVANLSNIALNTGDAAGDSYISIEGLTGSSFDDTLTGDASANIISGGDGNDTIYGGLGADTLSGGNGGVDILIYTDSAAGVSVNAIANTASGGEAEGDVISGFEVIFGSAYNDSLAALGAISAGAGDDTLMYGSHMTGGTGNDSIQADFYGGYNYYFALGDGQDILNASLYGTDEIHFGAGIAAGNVSAYAAGQDLIITYGAMGDKITIVNGALNPNGLGVPLIRFADGSTMNPYYNAAVNTIAAYSSAVVVSGSNGNDTIRADFTNVVYGGAGNDTIDVGAYGNPTFAFSMGDGSDTITPTLYDGPDEILFCGGMTSADLSYSRVGDNLVISYGSGNSVTVTSYYYQVGFEGPMPIKFSDGSVAYAPAL